MLNLLNNVLIVIPLLAVVVAIVRLFMGELTFRTKIFVALLMFVAGISPFLRLPVVKVLEKQEKLTPPQLDVNMGYSDKGNLFIVADSKNDVPYKARWVICTKKDEIVSGIMIEDVIFYPKPNKRRMQYKEEIQKDKVIDDYIELRFDYRSVYAEEKSFPDSLSGKVIKKYKMSQGPNLIELTD